MEHRTLIIIDAVINLGLGILLLFFPTRVVAYLEMPPTDQAFYPSILGAVLIGIGVALLTSLLGKPSPLGGLGLRGAVAINLAGAFALSGWIVWGALELTERGKAILAIIATVLILLSFVEFVAVKKSPEG